MSFRVALLEATFTITVAFQNHKECCHRHLPASFVTMAYHTGKLKLEEIMNQRTWASKVHTLAMKVLGNLVQIAGSLASFACLAMVKVYEVHFATVQASAKDSCNTYTLYII